MAFLDELPLAEMTELSTAERAMTEARAAEMAALETAGMSEFLELELGVNELRRSDIGRRRRITERRRRAGAASDGQRDQRGGCGQDKFHSVSFQVHLCLRHKSEVGTELFQHKTRRVTFASARETKSQIGRQRASTTMVRR